MQQHIAPINNFQLLDEILTQASVDLLTLNPQKRMITSFVELGQKITQETTNSQIINALIKTLEIIVYAQLKNFPGNIFWDFDFMVSSMLRLALLENDGAVDFLETFGQKMVSLTELFGGKSEIRFRYVHDFTYGFDWARWVQKDPKNRVTIEPFSLIFLDYLLDKSEELRQRIHQGRSQSYKLCATGFRNPFTFSREPEDEYRLFTHLAQDKLIPVPAWSWNASPVWNQPFEEMREQLALKLNIQPQRH
ncbi:conserved hypothetical protein [Trichormus variabilis ATCC 29413]|uniref:Ferrochelatase n=2 Tax=Anabaena variabilis TaxID=264691 RepID=Q3M3G4_TRIV2|nr:MULTISPECIES: hypothetical protein [Nostocaceae]ABA24472.1 conserved hypothetical protein [Trichormus variabilis ATCC 29413]MBC1217031.1 hypothetical protein [Trichormus variabilis ARAD]MBC1254691.1 hypothetical protein [Trichormus variabilis V5]MBC1267904.1 hypothetical protein [Trichormus variabilis FSR]MBC1302177.1 hypothetical protein [Trichormus variabilis N2B]